jgi:hypothetical protein
MSKRGRGLDKTLINLPRIKKRLAYSLKKLSGTFQDSEYTFLAETARKDIDTLLEYAKTPEEKLKYTQYIFKLGQLYMWKPWKVGTLSDEKGSDYILGKAMQAEEDQWKYQSIVRERKRVAENKREALNTLGARSLFEKRKQTGLSVRIPQNTDSRELREYKDARKRVVIAKGKLDKFRKMVEVKEKRFKARENRNNFEEWKNTYSAWKKAQAEFYAATRDEPVKKKAYEDSKKPKAPKARGFLKRKRI